MFIVLFFLLVFISISFAINVTVLAFGISKDSTRIKGSDPYPFNLHILIYAFEKVFSMKNESVKLKSIFDNCTSDFDWEDESLKWMNKIFSSKNGEYFVHIGPLCEYSEVEAANSEFAGYIADTQKRSKSGHQVFVTPTLGFRILLQDLSRRSHYSTIEPTSSTSIESNSIFVPLNANYDYYSELIFNFTTDFLSPYTAFLCKFYFMQLFIVSITAFRFRSCQRISWSYGQILPTHNRQYNAF